VPPGQGRQTYEWLPSKKRASSPGEHTWLGRKKLPLSMTLAGYQVRDWAASPVMHVSGDPTVTPSLVGMTPQNTSKVPFVKAAVTAVTSDATVSGTRYESSVSITAPSAKPGKRLTGAAAKVPSMTICATSRYIGPQIYAGDVRMRSPTRSW